MEGRRRGEKLGWTLGWIGGFIWLAALAVMFLLQARWAPGIIGLLLLALAVAAIVLLAPWRHPEKPYRVLMLGPYAVFFLSVAWALWAFGGPARAGLNWWSLLWLTIIVLPLFQAGNKKWKE